jgi:FMN phosphatase YigB (HAD superfamily)
MSLYSEWAKNRREQEIREGYKKQGDMEMQKITEWIASKNNKITLFIDQDETLLVTRNLETIARMGVWANQTAIHESIMGHHVGIVVRPGAKQFLLACKQIATTVILTAGITPYQEEVLEAAGLLNLVDEVYGRDRYHSVPKDRAGLLVEDRAPNDQIVQEKLAAMGGGLYIKVPAWHGGDQHDNALAALPARIKSSLSSLI